MEVSETDRQQIQLIHWGLRLNMSLTLNKYVVENCSTEVNSKNFNLVIRLQRLSLPFWFSLFIPSVCLILAAEVALFIDETHFEAMIMVSLTSNLVMYTLYSSIQQELPKDSSLKLIDIWLLHGLLMPMVVFILLATKELTNTTTSSKEVPKSNFIKVTDSSLISLNNKTTTENGEIAKKNNVLLVCQALVPVLTMIFILTFFIVMCKKI